MAAPGGRGADRSQYCYLADGPTTGMLWACPISAMVSTILLPLAQANPLLEKLGRTGRAGSRLGFGCVPPLAIDGLNRLQLFL